uniref:putative RING-H2 finger protein ATL69 n=1 Tax=Erigeron canadensis TaxID=72917 RepID=UPI001CB8F9D8|nr:putative RING-H2 finger protein ATL69 [Erigeron canadensis]
MINGTVETDEPSYKSEYLCASLCYGLELYSAMLFLLFTISYTLYMCNRMRSTSATISDVEDVNGHYVSFPQGLEDVVISTFPTFTYKDRDTNNNCDSSCSICLADYEAADVIRLLTECGHLFHSGGTKYIECKSSKIKSNNWNLKPNVNTCTPTSLWNSRIFVLKRSVRRWRPRAPKPSTQTIDMELDECEVKTLHNTSSRSI